jgi:hypothetical protein
MPPVNNIAGLSLAFEWSGENVDPSFGTVRAGENHLAQVALRLGVDLASLLQSNPEVVDPGRIRVGQGIRVPQPGTEQTEQAYLKPQSDLDRVSGLSPAPLGDPMAKGFVQERLSRNPLTQHSADSISGKNQLRYADGDGASSGMNTVSATVAAPPSSSLPVALLKSPDIGLKTPSEKDLKRLSHDLRNAITKADAAEKNAEAAEKKAATARAKSNSPSALYPKDMIDADQAEGLAEKAKKERDVAYAAVDKVLQDVVDTFGIGRDGATGLSYSPNQTDLGDTATTASAISRDALKSPGIAASVILHESNHARRNQELASAGIDRGKFGANAEEIYSALTEMEGDTFESKNSKTLGTDADWVKGAENLRQAQIKRLTDAGAGKDVIECAKNGLFDEALTLFRRHLSEDSQSHKYLYKK